ncbi:MAG: mannose-1-phosphate guanylyltransferase [Hyphomonadaceae bacterium]
MKHRIIPALLSGGAGRRLWPASTQARPKQFHAFAGPRTLIQETALRAAGEHGALSFAPPIVLANAAHADLAEAQLAEIGIAPAALVLEPMGRNTAATAALAAALAAEIEPEAKVLLLPADHIVRDVGAFHAALLRAAPAAQSRIVTFGVTPDRPETGYGYIKRGAALSEGVYAIEAFKEKPDAQLAQSYLVHGGYAWNAGMFFFTPAVLLREFAASADIRDLALAALAQAKRKGARVLLSQEAFARVPALPLDIAVMEKTQLGAVAPADIGWADLGAWDEIWRLAEKDAAGNALHGDALALDARGNLLRSDGPSLAVLGVDDLIVIAHEGRIVIAPRARAQEVKRLLEASEKAQR